MELSYFSIQAIVDQASEAAHEAALQILNRQGDCGACGFAWVNIWEYQGKKIRANSTIGKALTAAGIRKDYTGGFCLWNPAKLPVQSVDVLDQGATAAAAVFKSHGFTAYAGSRLD